VVQFADSHIWVHSAQTGLTVTDSDPDILLTLAAFRTPQDPEVVISGAPDPANRRRRIQDLERIGALISGDCTQVTSEPNPSDLVERYLSPIAESLDSLAGALGAIGPEVSQAIRDETGIGLDARLIGANAGLIAARQVLGSRMRGWVRNQLRRLNLAPKGLSIHLGSGSAHLDGWVNIDLWPAQLSLDFRWGLPFEAGSADRVYLSHVLEHAYYPHETLQLVREIHRVLTPGGRVRIIVPDIEACIQAYVTNDRRFFEGRRERWPEWKITTRMESFLGFAGVGAHPGMFGLAHKWGFDFETLAHLLSTVGFTNIERSAYQKSSDPALRLDHASAWAGANVDGRFYSLFVEATR
jgi:predicted SAM-dependent methyltransferase